MADYIQFISDVENAQILIEVKEGEISAQQGVEKAGLREWIGNTVARAQTTFEEGLDKMLRYNSEVFIRSVSNLPVLPAEAELTFGLKATGEVGNIAVAKVASEANYTIKLTWKRETKSTQQNEP